MPKTITPATYQQIIDYRKQAITLGKQIDKMVMAAESLTGDKEDFMFEYIHNGGNLKKTLKNMGVEIEKKSKGK